MTNPDATPAALPDPAQKKPSESVSQHYDTRLPGLPWFLRIQIPFIAAAVYSVIRLLGPTLRYEVLGWQNAERVHASGKRCRPFGTASSFRLSGGTAIKASW
jgi:hypothetical protein